jgi:hypothetical protein
MMRYLRNFRWIGRSVVEVLVDKRYSDEFINRVGEFNGIINVLDDFDVMKPITKTANETRELCIRSLVKQIESSNDETVVDFFKSLIESFGPKAISLAKKVGKMAKSTNIDSDTENLHYEPKEKDSNYSEVYRTLQVRMEEEIEELVQQELDFDTCSEKVSEKLKTFLIPHNLESILTNRETTEEQKLQETLTFATETFMEYAAFVDGIDMLKYNVEIIKEETQKLSTKIVELFEEGNFDGIIAMLMETFDIKNITIFIMENIDDLRMSL